MSTKFNKTTQGWWATNWKWVLPVGCLGTIVMFVALGFSIFAFVTGTMKSSWPYAEGVKLAKANPAVVDALGAPLRTTWWFSGSMNVSGPSGEAELAIPLRGSQGSGTLYVIAHKRAGEWSFELAEVAIKGNDDRIDLLSQDGVRVSNYALNLSVTSLAVARAAPAG
jgi:hypothetical protein